MSGAGDYLGGGAGVARNAIHQEHLRQATEAQKNKIEKSPENSEFSKSLGNKVVNVNRPEKNGQIKETGTDLALKKVAQEYEKQFLGLMWNFASETSYIDHEYEGGLGEEIFRKEVINEMAKSIKSEEMGNLAKSIYEDLKRRTDAPKKE